MKSAYDPVAYHKRINSKKNAWIANIMRVLGKTKEEAEELYLKINPYK